MKKYQAPEVEVVEFSPNGILCLSGTENVEEKNGTWGNGFFYEYESGFTIE